VALVELRVQIVNPLGLHARPAAEFVKLASRFQSNVSLTKEDQLVNGKSILGVMTLAAEYGSELIIRADGPDADDAAVALAQLVARGFSVASRTAGCWGGSACRRDWPSVPPW